MKWFHSPWSTEVIREAGIAVRYHFVETFPYSAGPHQFWITVSSSLVYKATRDSAGAPDTRQSADRHMCALLCSCWESTSSWTAQAQSRRLARFSHFEPASSYRCLGNPSLQICQQLHPAFMAMIFHCTIPYNERQ